MNLITNIGSKYAVTSDIACTISTADGMLILSVEPGVQGFFVALGSSVLCSNDGASIIPFKGAALGGSSQGGAKAYMPVVMLDCGSAIELTSGVMYRLTLGDEPDNIYWQNLSMESHPARGMRCEICIDARGYTAHSITWPSSWIWLDGHRAKATKRLPT